MPGRSGRPEVVPPPAAGLLGARAAAHAIGGLLQIR